MLRGTFLAFCVLFPVLEGAKKPHILFIVADDLGWNDVGWHNPDIYTPNLDKLAHSGVILNSSYVHPICTPSRNSFLTGVYPFRVGLSGTAIDPRQPRFMSLDTPTLPEKLKKLGYSTHMIGKWHLGFCNENYTPTRRGFDSFLGFYAGAQDYYKHMNDGGYDFRFNKTVFYPPKKQYSTKTYAKRAVDIIKEHKKNKNPLFLYLAFQSVHTPLQVPKKYEKRYQLLKNKDRKIFSGMVTAMDDAVGAVMAAFKKHKFLGNLVVVFTTDNGGAAHIVGNNFPLRGSKTTLWEGGTRAVSFVYSKNHLKKNGYVHEGLFHSTDWFPTLLAAAGGKPKLEKHIDGINQWPMIRSGKPSRRTEFVYDIDKSRPSSAIRMGDYKLIVGNPGDYNSWYRVAATDSFCPIYDKYETDSDQDIFIYESLNRMVRNAKGYVRWLTAKIPGFNMVRKWHRYRQLKRCEKLKKHDKTKWIFPKYLLYNIKDDPSERKNIAGYKPMLVLKMKKRLERYQRKAVPQQTKKKDPRADPKRYNGVWTPGWCK
ncbi:arylsulfatase I-like [Saccostrea echinata]|uniref:arylsulfatase I-like n=1 Tax=Saccostrea echinata TaxID=191078 RepID=UPI002A82A186|nr:arylsulfatase I-like [Saccostrea echinata]